MRVALLEPPATDPRSPHLAMASLHAALALDGVEVEVIDGGAEALAWLCRRDRVAASLETLQRNGAGRDAEAHQAFLRRIGPLLVEGVDDALATLRHPTRFFDAAELDQAREVLNRALSLHSAANGRHGYTIAPIRYGVAGIDPSRLADLEAATAAPQDGLFGTYFEHVVSRLRASDPQLVALSILNHQQILPGLTLARLLKADGRLVVIGGTVYAKFVEQLRARPRFFELFCDAVCCYEGESAIRALAAEAGRAHQEGRPVRFDGIANLLWLDPTTATVQAGPILSEDVAALPTPCFDGFDLGLYLVPEPVLPILTGKGCYFNHCKFCDIPFINRVAPRPYRRRGAEQVAADIATLWHRHGARHFVVTDEALAPRFLLQITEALADHPGVDPRLVGYARFEAGFDGPTCQALHDGGVRRLFFGLESGSQRMLDHMNKGVDVDTAHAVLGHCADAGIGFHLFSMIGLPEETEADAAQTLAFFLDEAERIDHPRNTLDLHRFNLDLRTEYFDNAERYGLQIDRTALEQADFPLDAPRWNPTRGLSHDDAARLVAEQSTVLRARLRRSRVFPAHIYPSYEEYWVLYADRFAADGDWSLRFELPTAGDALVCTLRWCAALAVAPLDGGVLLSSPSGEHPLSEAAFALLHPAPPSAPVDTLLDGLAARVPSGTTAELTEQFRGELRTIIDDLLAVGLLRLQVEPAVAASTGKCAVNPSTKAYRAGTDRVVDPAETVARVRPLFPMLGITRVADVTGLDHIGLPVVMVVRPNARSLSVAQGKGIDFDAAAASGIMESIEAWHAERPQLALRLGCQAELRWSLPLADVTALPVCLEAPWSPEVELLWCEGQELLGGGTRYVPYELVHTNYTLPRPTGSGLFLATSNGLASGNVMVEALSHALCEVIERDATTLWHLRDEAGRAATRIELSTVDEPLCRAVLDTYQRANVAVGVWEITSDVGLPSFYTVILDEQDHALNRLHAAAGMGCHPKRSIALLRALTEAAQSRLTLIAGSRDDIVSDDYRRVRAPHLLADERRLLTEAAGVRSFREVPDLESDTLEGDVAQILQRLVAVGIEEVVAVDLTRAEIGVSVVRVVVPGLEAASEIAGYVPGRRARAWLEANRP